MRPERERDMEVDHENRIRALEQTVTTLKAQLEPIFGLVTKLEALTSQLSDLKASLGSMKGQAVILGTVGSFFASLVSSVVCGIVVYKLTH
jgi:cell shape-determining protein MreC